MLAWTDEAAQTHARCDRCGHETKVRTPGTMPRWCYVCMVGAGPPLGYRKLAPHRTELLRRTITTLLRDGNMDRSGMQTRVAQHFKVTRQYVSQIVKEIRNANE